jgi:hypothetical protein
MLLVTGNIGGKNYKDEIVPARELAKTFGLPDYDAKGTYLIQMNPELIGRGPNGKKTPKSITRPTWFTGHFEGAGIMIRYYTSAVPKGNGLVSYAPSEVGFYNRAESISFTAANYDLFVFMALCPFCADSPFADKGKIKWQVFSDRKESDKAEKILAIHTDLIGEIMDKSLIEQTIIRAKGMKFKKQTISRSDLDKPAMVQMQLIRWLQEDPVAFEKAWNSGENVFTGLVLECRDRRFIKKEVKSGRQSWIWNAGQKAGSVIVFISKSDNPETVLTTALAGGGNYQENLAYMTNLINSPAEGESSSAIAIDGEAALSALKSISSPAAPTPGKIKEMDVQQLVEQAMAKDMVGLDRVTGEVRYIYNGDYANAPIFVASDRAAWKDELVAFLKGNKDAVKSFRQFCLVSINK